MEKERAQRYVAGLEQVIRNTHLDLKETMVQFQEYSQWFTLERTVPPPIITNIRRTYKGIQDQLTKIRGISQLLESRYRQHYRRDSLRDKDISEFGILSKNLYTRFESILLEMEANDRLKDIKEDSDGYTQHIPSQWFRSTENQLTLQRNLQGLYELDYIYKTGMGVDVGQRHRVIQDRLRSLSLFVLSGEGGLMDILQSRIRLREYDLKERYAKDELRGALTHLREISVSEVEGVIKRFIDSREVPKLKCLLLSIQSHADLRKEKLSSANTILKRMTSGEVRTVQI
jgi:hypothetical protein